MSELDRALDQGPGKFLCKGPAVDIFGFVGQWSPMQLLTSSGVA